MSKLTDLPAVPLEIPIRNVDQLDAMRAGFRMLCCEVSATSNTPSAAVSSGAGCGSPYIAILEWGDKHALVHAVDLLEAWVRTFDPAGADRIKESR